MSICTYKPLKNTWRRWVSGYDDPNRPTENTALKNIRDEAMLSDWMTFISQFED
jgi:hypothetical protein